MRALTGQPVEPTLTVREARPGDRYLLCSDGLSDVVTSETLADTLGSVEDHRACADRLIELALRGGGPDNVTVVVADVVDTQYGDSRPIVGGAAGTDDQNYTPNPATAAGRAAALRPPPPEPRRPSLIDEEPPARKSPLDVAGDRACHTVIAGIVAGFFVIRAMVSSSHYAGVEDGKVDLPGFPRQDRVPDVQRRRETCSRAQSEPGPARRVLRRLLAGIGLLRTRPVRSAGDRS